MIKFQERKSKCLHQIIGCKVIIIIIIISQGLHSLRFLVIYLQNKRLIKSPSNKQDKSLKHIEKKSNFFSILSKLQQNKRDETIHTKIRPKRSINANQE